jgi:hypothetical protein
MIGVNQINAVSGSPNFSTFGSANSPPATGHAQSMHAPHDERDFSVAPRQ